jgi:hypothetical protein
MTTTFANIKCTQAIQMCVVLLLTKDQLFLVSDVRNKMVIYITLEATITSLGRSRAI